MITAETVHDLDRELIWITVTGPLSSARKQDLRMWIGKALVACPRAVIVDLTGFEDQTGTAASLLQAAAASAREYYGVFLLFVTPAGGPLRAQLGTRFWRHALHLFADRAAAEAAALAGPPPPDRFGLVLEPDGHASSRARLLVHDACRAWALPALAAPASRVVFELVHNAATHAGTDVAVTVSLRGSYLHLAVRDGRPDAPARLLPARRTDPVLADPPGDGLHVVDRNATAWGSAFDGRGKTVWAVIRLPGGTAP
ncbi:ATP-binding protein [Dactylosporangium sp. NPDC000244]|uniref:ATP-binding protein n=1 Tax=Dactylosporangium sp. NPDC000244 TaxID=3154365 RepID=UPI00333499AC